MLRRNLLIGGLVAGAFVLPSLAVAGVVTGVCSNCHTMHASQNGSNLAGKAQLLTGTGCVGCHAEAGKVNNTTTGKSDQATGAPQVIGTTGGINTAGYFDLAAATDNKQHNVNEDFGAGAWKNADAAMTGNIPGSTGAYSGYTLNCSSCHTTTGHHTATNYRMLANAAATPILNDYNPNAATVFPGDRSVVAYNATNMNQVCANCHTRFHSTTYTNAASPFVRHPTGNVISGYGVGATSIDPAATPTDRVPMGAGSEVMCLSCHVAHGGPYTDLLSFSYSTNQAGGTVASEGCETCHSYGGNGM